MSTHQGRPWYRWFPRDFMASSSVQSMTWEERGIYRWLLDIQWLDESIPADLKKIARLLNLSGKQFATIWEAIGPCFSPDPNDATKLVNTRLNEIKVEMIEAAEKAAEKGRRGGKASAETRRKKSQPADPEIEPVLRLGSSKTEADALQLGSLQVEAKSNHADPDAYITPNGVSASHEPAHEDAPTPVRDDAQAGVPEHTHETGHAAPHSTLEAERGAPERGASPTPQSPPPPKPETANTTKQIALKLPKKPPSERDLAAWAITAELAKRVEPLLEGMTAGDWRKRNNDAARDLVDAGYNAERCIKAWDLFAERGKPYTVLKWLQDAMTAEKTRVATTQVRPQGSRYEQPHTAYNGTPPLIDDAFMAALR